MAGADVVDQVIGRRRLQEGAQASKGKVPQQDLCQACAAHTLGLLLEDMVCKQLQGEG